jgi:hypothetical protein
LRSISSETSFTGKVKVKTKYFGDGSGKKLNLLVDQLISDKAESEYGPKLKRIGDRRKIKSEQKSVEKVNSPLNKVRFELLSIND